MVRFSTWYLNKTRVLGLIGAAQIIKSASSMTSPFENIDQLLGGEIAETFIKGELERWLTSNEIPSLGELVTTGTLKEGSHFTLYHDFYGKGLSKYNNVDVLPRDAVAEIYCNLRSSEGVKVRLPYSPKNLCTDTAWSRLKGHTRLFAFGYVETIEENCITARPYLIGDISGGLDEVNEDTWVPYDYGEIHVSQIKNFSKIRKVLEGEIGPPNIEVLKNIPEKEIKAAFAEIIHEGNVPKDWGGEQSDLFSANIVYKGEMRPSAFLFKGPSKFKPMTVADLGKNGDQIVRLFNEPADILILQHCHSVTSPVRANMRAFASRIHDLRNFVIIDGYDTVRILMAYNKCGL